VAATREPERERVEEDRREGLANELPIDLDDPPRDLIDPPKDPVREGGPVSTLVLVPLESDNEMLALLPAKLASVATDVAGFTELATLADED